MKHLVINKLKSNSGESIAETLVAVLIAAVALLMLAGTVNTASNLISNSQDKLKQYYEANNNLEQRNGGTLGKKVTISGAGTLLDGNSYSATTYENNELKSGAVIAYDISQTP